VLLRFLYTSCTNCRKDRASAPFFGLAKFRLLSKFGRRKNCIKGSTCSKHCRMEFMKQVFPRLSNPTSCKLMSIIGGATSMLWLTEHPNFVEMTCELSTDLLFEFDSGAVSVAPFFLLWVPGFTSGNPLPGILVWFISSWCLVGVLESSLRGKEGGCGLRFSLRSLLCACDYKITSGNKLERHI